MRVEFSLKGYPTFTMDAHRLVLGNRRIGIENECGRQSLLRRQDNGFYEIKIDGRPIVTHGREFVRTVYEEA